MIVFARPLFLFSMAYGVDNAAVVCCFMTSDYCVRFYSFLWSSMPPPLT